MHATGDTFLDYLWSFLRGEVSDRTFEAWICANEAAEERLGGELYFAAISCDYRSARAIAALEAELYEYARAATGRACRCIELADYAVVAMTQASEAIVGTFETTKRRGRPFWWLSLRRCRDCAAWWLMAQEERHNDIYCLERLDAEQAAEIVDEDRWPAKLDTYEALLEIGFRAGSAVEFVDPLGNSSLASSIEDLARARPGIALPDLARLLNIDVAVARTLAERVARDEGVSIGFDD